MLFITNNVHPVGCYHRINPDRIIRTDLYFITSFKRMQICSFWQTGSNKINMQSGLIICNYNLISVIHLTFIFNLWNIKPHRSTWPRPTSERLLSANNRHWNVMTSQSQPSIPHLLVITNHKLTWCILHHMIRNVFKRESGWSKSVQFCLKIEAATFALDIATGHWETHFNGPQMRWNAGQQPLSMM